MTIERTTLNKLIAFMSQRDFSVHSVDDGGEVFKKPTRNSAIDALLSVDESYIWFNDYAGTCDPHSVFIVNGEGVDCITDWTSSRGDPDGFAAAMDTFMDTL